MIKTETREYVRGLITEAPQGISLSELHSKVHRTLTRLQLRTTLDTLYMKGEISKERVSEWKRRETRYYPFNGKQPMKRTRKQQPESESKMLAMTDFMPGRKYAAYIDF